MKKVRIELKFRPSWVVYEVVKLVNCATFTLSVGKQCGCGPFMIGSTLQPREAEALAADRRFEVTITQEK